MKTILSFIFIFFVSISFSQDVKLIELEVNKLYEQYSKKGNHVIKTRLELDTLAFCQLRYLETLTDVNDITHQNPDPKFKTFTMRVHNYFINTMGESFSEVISGSYKGNGNYIDEKSVAKVLFNALLVSCLAIIVVSCDKKMDMEMSKMDITMNYLPTPAIKDVPIAFTFSVKQDNVFQAVTMTSCEVIKNGVTKVMSTTEKEAGQYIGTYTFTESGNYELHFKYMHKGVDTDQDFTLVVQ